MTFKPSRLLLALVAFAAVPSFAQNLAVVNGKAIPSSRADEIVKQVVAQGQQKDTPELRAKIKDALVAQEVQLQEALKQGLDKKPEVKEAIEGAQQDILIRAMVSDYVRKHPVAEADIKAEYDAFLKRTGDKEYHVRHILAENEADAKAAIAKIKAGAKFEDVAKTMSKDTGSAPNGGDLDWALPSSFPAEFGAAVAQLQKGSVTEAPVKTAAGYHVIKVDDVRAAKLPSFDELKQQIGQNLLRQKVAAYQQELVKAAKIK